MPRLVQDEAVPPQAAAWSPADVAAWVRRCDIVGGEDIAQKMLEKEVDGAALLGFQTKWAVREQLDLALGKANKVWQAIETLKAAPAGTAPDPLQLWIKTPDGTTLSVIAKNGAATSVAQIRTQLAEDSGVDESACRIIFAGRELGDDLTLADYNCENTSELNLILRVSQLEMVAEADASVDTEAQEETAALRGMMVGKKLKDFGDFVKVGGKDIAAMGGGGYSQSGVCSYVYLSGYKASLIQGDGKQLALKVMLNYNTADSTLALGTEFDAETALLSDPVRLPAHRNVIAVLHSFADTAVGLPGWDFDPTIVMARTMIVVMPFLPKDLKAVFKSIRRRGEQFTDARATRTVYQLLLAVRHLKTHNIVHRDIKLDNVLLANVGTEQETAVLTDFGMCFDLQKNGVENFRVMMPYDGFRRGGAPIALAPEITLPTPGPAACLDYSKNDEWAVGMVAHELFSSNDEHTPFADMEHPSTYTDEGYRDAGISGSCRPLVRELLRVAVGDRLEAAEGSRRARALLDVCESEGAADRRIVALEAELEALRTRAVSAEHTSAALAVELAAESADMEAWKASSQAQAEKLAVAASKLADMEEAAADAEKEGNAAGVRVAELQAQLEAVEEEHSQVLQDTIDMVAETETDLVVQLDDEKSAHRACKATLAGMEEAAAAAAAGGAGSATTAGEKADEEEEPRSTTPKRSAARSTTPEQRAALRKQKEERQKRARRRLQGLPEDDQPASPRAQVDPLEAIQVLVDVCESEGADERRIVALEADMEDAAADAAQLPATSARVAELQAQLKALEEHGYVLQDVMDMGAETEAGLILQLKLREEEKDIDVAILTQGKQDAEASLAKVTADLASKEQELAAEKASSQAQAEKLAVAASKLADMEEAAADAAQVQAGDYSEPLQALFAGDKAKLEMSARHAKAALAEEQAKSSALKEENCVLRGQVATLLSYLDQAYSMEGRGGGD